MPKSKIQFCLLLVIVMCQLGCNRRPSDTGAPATSAPAPASSPAPATGPATTPATAGIERKITVNGVDLAAGGVPAKVRIEFDHVYELDSDRTYPLSQIKQIAITHGGRQEAIPCSDIHRPCSVTIFGTAGEIRVYEKPRKKPGTYNTKVDFDDDEYEPLDSNWQKYARDTASISRIEVRRGLLNKQVFSCDQGCAVTVTF